jgi:phage-related protein
MGWQQVCSVPWRVVYASFLQTANFVIMNADADATHTQHQKAAIIMPAAVAVGTMFNVKSKTFERHQRRMLRAGLIQ